MAGAFGKVSRRAHAGKEVAMFQMLNEDSTQPEDRRIKTARVGALTIALLALGAVVYFFAFLP
jgi:ATP:corrinoid adenosyltransferase